MRPILETIVIGAGQAGLTAAYYLKARGLQPAVDFLVLDANDGPGGAWRHRWDSLTFESAHDIHPLPRFSLPKIDSNEPSNRVVPRYYGAFEEEHDLQVTRPVHVSAVEQAQGAFDVQTDRGRFTSKTVINATGTWDSPFVPYYPGLESFRGSMLHTRSFKGPHQFVGPVLVVGGGTSSVQHIQELHAAGVPTIWSTRGTPRWTETRFDEDWGQKVEDGVMERTSAGLRPLSVVAATGLPLCGRYVPDIESGLLISRGPIVRFTHAGVVLDGPGPNGHQFPSQGQADRLISAATRRAVTKLPGKEAGSGSRWETPISEVLWSTGFRANVAHLAPLKLREREGGIKIAADGVSVPKMPGFFFTGYGASSSTLGATRAGRRAAAEVLRVVNPRTDG